MTKWAGLLLGASLLCLAPRAAAQEDASLEDSALSEDAAIVEDAAVTPDAAVVTDAAVVEDAVVVEDAAVSVDATGLEDAATAVDAGTADTATSADATLADATLADAASGDAGVPCGSVTFIGECDGTTVRYCAGDNQLIELDCAVEFGSGATCGLTDCTGTDCRGYFCVAASGQTCDETLGCDVSANQGCIAGTCASSTACDPATYVPSCDGDALSYCAYTVGRNDCSEGDTQPYVCGTTSGGDPGCLGTAGGLCDLPNGFECAAGLDCVDNVCTAPGTDAGVVDSGSAADAASVGDDDDAEAGCGCSAGGAGSSALLLLAGLLGLALRRRR